MVGETVLSVAAQISDRFPFVIAVASPIHILCIARGRRRRSGLRSIVNLVLKSERELFVSVDGHTNFSPGES